MSDYKCPKCGNPFLHRRSLRTADGHTPWKDADGTWYDGPAREEIVTSCDAMGCDWRIVTYKRRGKPWKPDEALQS